MVQPSRTLLAFAPFALALFALSLFALSLFALALFALALNPVLMCALHPGLIHARTTRTAKRSTC